MTRGLAADARIVTGPARALRLLRDGDVVVPMPGPSGTPAALDPVRKEAAAGTVETDATP